MDKMKLKEKIGEKIDALIEQGITSANLEPLDKLVDMMKDVHEIEKIEKEGGKQMYREGGYGNQGGGYSGEYGRQYRNQGGYSAGNYSEGGYSEGGYSEGGYSEGGNYGRRGVKGTGRGRRRYRGDDMLDDMYGAYGEYSEGKEEYNRGNYGAEDKKIKSLEYMLGAVVEFVKMLEKDADSQEEVQLIKKYTKKLTEM